MIAILIPEDAISTVMWDYRGHYEQEDTGIHDALFANLMGWA